MKKKQMGVNKCNYVNNKLSQNHNFDQKVKVIGLINIYIQSYANKSVKITVMNKFIILLVD